jgi:hypothetical protein
MAAAVSLAIAVGTAEAPATLAAGAGVAELEHAETMIVAATARTPRRLIP